MRRATIGERLGRTRLRSGLARLIDTRNQPVAVRDLVLIGGGHAHVQVLRAIAMQPIPGVRVTMVARELRSPYSGMLPGHVAGAYSADEMHIDLARLATAAGARLILGEVMALDLSAQQVLCDSRPPIRYDFLSLNSGAVPQASGGGVSVKPIGLFLPEWYSACGELPEGSTLAVVGTGAGGVELALAIRQARGDLNIHLLGRTWLPGLNRRAAELLREACREQGIEITLDAEVTEQDGVLDTSTDHKLAVDATFWVTSVHAPAWLRDSGLEVDAAGFVVVKDTLQSTSHPNVLAAGDVACLQGQERPKAGVYAVRAGPVLKNNLRALLNGTALRRFRPQRNFLTLIGIGDGTAVAAKWNFAFRGRAMWRWKDYIDRTFMRRFQNLPEMAQASREPLPPLLAADAPDEMRCGGCGAKLGADLLSRVLGKLPISARDDVLVGIGDDAAQVRTASSMLMSTDGLRGMIDDTYRFGRIVTHHNLNDLYAMGARPTSALAVATVPLMSEILMEDELTQLLRGVVDVLEAHDVSLVGGHSAEGAELFLALTVMGEPGTHTFVKGGLSPGQALVLTKPIGTGVVLAAAMRGQADSDALMETVQCMDTSNAVAVGVLAEHGAVGVTDVTGFGLLGHLAEMLRASNVGADIVASDVPQLLQAQRLLEDGVQSSIQTNNEQALQDFAGDTTSACARLLSDPQTSGGLLAGVPQDQAERCVEALRQAGYASACVIGEVTDGVRRISS